MPGARLQTVDQDAISLDFLKTELETGITFADLTQPAPGFVNVSPSEVVALNPLIGAMIR